MRGIHKPGNVSPGDRPTHLWYTEVIAGASGGRFGLPCNGLPVPPGPPYSLDLAEGTGAWTAQTSGFHSA